MAVSALTLIADALGLLMVNAAGETPAPADAELCRRTLNRMLDAWALDGASTPLVARTVVNLVANTASYTIGSGGTVNIARPDTLVSAAIIADPSDTPVVEQPISVLDAIQWAAIRSKDSTSSVPSAVYYDRAYSGGLGNLYPWPVPSSSTPDLVLYTRTAMAAFADLSTAYVLPFGLEDALVSELAVRVAPHFEAVASNDVRRMAKAAGMAYRASNLVIPQVHVDPVILTDAGCGYDPVTDV